ncbi:PREDICTED: uncharacterized protein LOC109350510 [Lupinus angustifolius]|uniref:uncharacterized protein LOC109350510 n=1 Tax=Lupinus angustifolius TaxID=3871 RepID=UPI00092E4024|nr:PREDICTED: uncharacterized protein LOC109350510 [Lupinus angustifolius]
MESHGEFYGRNFTAHASSVEARPPDKPPDMVMEMNTDCMKVSFTDKVLEDRHPLPVREEVDLLAKGLAYLDVIGGNRLPPTITFGKNIIQAYSLEWRNVLIVTLIGKKQGFKIMRDKLKVVWKLSGNFELMDIDNGFFMVKFDFAPSRNKVMEGGPWMIFDHYVAISKWTSKFDSTTTIVTKTLVWIKFTRLNMFFMINIFFYPLSILFGRLVKIDNNTLKFARGRFARICLEIDLS